MIDPEYYDSNIEPEEAHATQQKRKFRVLLQQYVEEVAAVEVEAHDEHEAISLALLKAPDANWSEGDDAYSADAYMVEDEKGETVWER